MKKIILIIFIIISFWNVSEAEYTFNVGGSLNLGAGSNNFAPFYLHANNHGKITQSKNAQLDIWAIDSLDLNKRFDFSWGVEALGGYSNAVDYKRWDPEKKDWFANPQRPAAIWIQQLFAEVKWRCLYLSVGLKDRNSCFVDQNLSSGDMLWSGNSRGIPEVRIGFIDFQNIPWINGWVQADLCISYGKFVDTKYMQNHFDYYGGKIVTGSFWTYKRIALRTKPSQPFSFQFGFQMSGIFGGIYKRYQNGELKEERNNYNGFKDFFLMILPIDTKSFENNKTGDHKGTWDVAARYRFRGGETLRAYTQWFWEDGSGLLKTNGWDGLWGLEFKLNRRWWISGAVVEYLDLTNMSGPMAYEPKDFIGNTSASLPNRTHGADNYYNNHYYRAYVNYGLNMGTPMVQGTLFNTGYDEKFNYMLNNGAIPYFRVRGVHVAFEGSIGPYVDYIVKYNHRKAWGGSHTLALIKPVEADSFMAGAYYSIPQVEGLSLGAMFGLDHGSIPNNAIGGMLTLTYQRPISFKKKKNNETL